MNEMDRNPIHKALTEDAVYDGLLSNPLVTIFIVGLFLFIGILVFMKKTIKGPENNNENDQ